MLRPYSTLPLLVAGVAANNAHNTATAHDFAFVADTFYTRSYFHLPLPACAAVNRETYEYSRSRAGRSRAA